jgi:hypothetical protein
LPEEADLIQPHYTFSNPQLVPEYSHSVPGYEYRYAPQEYVPTTQGLMLDSLPAHVFVALPQTGEIVWVNNRYLTYRGQTVAELYENLWGPGKAKVKAAAGQGKGRAFGVTDTFF